MSVVKKEREVNLQRENAPTAPLGKLCMLVDIHIQISSKELWQMTYWH